MSNTKLKIQADFHPDWPVEESSDDQGGMIFQLDPNLPSVAVFVKWGPGQTLEHFASNLGKGNTKALVGTKEIIIHQGWDGRRVQIDMVSEGVEELPELGTKSNAGMSDSVEQRMIFVVYEVAMCGTSFVFGYRSPDWELGKRQAELDKIIHSVRCTELS